MTDRPTIPPYHTTDRPGIYHLFYPINDDETMAHEAENEAKQLDSVTDRQEEKDFDESKAAEAMSALSSAADTKAGESDGNTVKVSKEDVAVIVKELDVTEDEAKAALRAAAAEVGEGQSPVAAALRSLVVS